MRPKLAFCAAAYGTPRLEGAYLEEGIVRTTSYVDTGANFGLAATAFPGAISRAARVAGDGLGRM